MQPPLAPLPGLALALALAACAARPPVAAARRAPPRASPDAPPASRPEASAVRWLPGMQGGRCRPAGGAGGRRHAICGGLRASIGDDGARLSAQLCESPITDAVPVARGWAFVTNDGAVLLAEDFLGDAHPAGRVAPVAREVIASEGRLVIRAGGELYATDGSAPLAPAPVPAAGRAVSLAFVDALRGGAVLDGGALHRTTDGGATWHEVATPDAVALEVRAGAGVLEVSLSRGYAALPPTGPLGPAGARQVPVEVEGREGELAPADARRVTRALARRFPRALQRWPNAAEGPEGAWWVAEGRDLDVYDGATGELRREQRAALPGGCSELRRWGDGLAARCGLGWTRVGADASVTRNFGAEMSDLVLDDDGVHALARWPGRGLSRYDATAGRWTPVTVAAPATYHAQPRAMRGREALAVLGSQLLVVDPATPAARAVAFERPLPRAVMFQRLRWWPDGVISGVVRAAEAAPDFPPAMLHGTPDAALSLRPLPEGATQADLGDGARGLAAGAGRLWQTLDGGAHWTPIQGPEGGFPTGSEVVCDREGCTLGDALRVQGWSAPRVEAAGVLRALPPDAASDGGDAQGASFEIGARCGVQARIAPSPAPLPTGAPAPRAGWWVAGSTAVARVLWRERDEQGPTIRAVWAGVDGGGFYRAQGAEAPPPFAMQRPDAEEDWQTAAGRPVAATRAGLLFAVNDDASALLWAPARGAAFPFDALRRADDRITARLGGSFPLPDGSLALIVHETDPAADLALLLGPDGVVRRRRTLPRAGFAPRALAWVGGRPATATVALDRGSIRLEPWDDPSAATTVPLREPVVPCRGSTPPGSPRVFVSARDGVSDVADEGWSAQQITYVAAPRGVCVAQIAGTTAGGEEGGLAVGMVVVAARPDGTLAGFADDGTRRAAMRCHAAPRP